jgi:uncharacterized protein with PIN domain
MRSIKCPNCAESMVVIKVDMDHHRRLPNGRQVKMHFRDVPVEECPSCGERYFQARTIKEMDRAIDEKYGVRRPRAA